MSVKKWFLTVGAIGVLALYCSNPTGHAGNASQTGNVKGTLAKVGGSPASNAKVRFISVDYNPSGSAKVLATIDSTTTDSDGNFGLDLDTGTYNMFAEDDTLLAYEDSITVGDDTITITDTVKAPGKITGISFMPGQDSANQARVTIYAPGTDFYVKPDVGGAFSFDNVPEGTFRLIFDPTLDQYDLKIISISVTSGETTDLDTVILYGTSITGMPVADAGNDTTVSINDTIRLYGTAKDTLGQIVRMEWDIGNTGTFVEVADTFAIAPNTATTYKCVFRVVDNDSNAETDTLVVSVIQDVPTANAGNDTTVSINDSCVLRGSGTDIYGSIVKYRFDFNGDGTFDDSSETSGEVKFMGPSDTGSHNVILQVEDDDGNKSNDTMVVSVILDLPVVDAGNDTTIAYGTSAALNGTTTDSFGTIVKYEWDFDGSGSQYGFVETSTGDTSFVPDSAGWVYFRATDDDGNTNADSLRIRFTVWTQRQDMPTARYRTAAATVNGKIYVFGGIDSDILEEYDIENNTWTTKSSMPTARGPIAAVVVNEKIYVLGDRVRDATSVLEEYDPSNDTWSTKTSMPNPNQGATTAVVNGKIYVFSSYASGPVDEYDPISDTWTNKTPVPDGNFNNNLFAATINNEVFVFIKKDDTLRVYNYSPGSDAWTINDSDIVGYPNNVDTGLKGMAFQHQIYMFSSGVSICAYDPISKILSQKTSAPSEIVSRLDGAACVANNKIYFFGGSYSVTSMTFYSQVVTEYSPSLDY